MGKDPFPFSEQAIFSYVRHLIQTGAPPTRAKRFRETVAFCNGTLGARGAEEVLASSRIKGAAIRAYGEKRLLKKRDPLKHRWVDILEAITTGPTPDVSKVFAGFVCFVLHSRARWFDALHITSEPVLDLNDKGDGFIEAQTEKTKTSNTWVKRCRPLALVADATGVMEGP